MARDSLKAVHDDDLDELLKSLNVYNHFVHEKLKCAFCGDIITYENLHSIFPDSGSVKLCCNKPQCVNSLLSRIESRRA
jgi:hypothetical protein